MLNSCDDHQDCVVVHEGFHCPVCAEQLNLANKIEKLEIALDEYEEGSSNAAVKKSQ